MRRLVLCIALMLVMAHVVLADEPTYSLTIRGEAVTMAVPDEAVVYLSIQTKQHRRRSSAKQEMDREATTLVRYLLEAGVEERKFKTTNRRVSAVYDHSSGKRRLIGYIGYQRFEVILALEDADELLDGMPPAISEALNPYSDIEDPMLCCRKAARALDCGSQPFIPFCGRPDHDRRQDLEKMRVLCRESVGL